MRDVFSVNFQTLLEVSGDSEWTEVASHNHWVKSVYSETR